jgi:hypothetical protein
MEGGIPDLLAAALRPARTRLTSINHPASENGDQSRRSRSRCAPGHPGCNHATSPTRQTDTRPETGHQHNQ